MRRLRAKQDGQRRVHSEQNFKTKANDYCRQAAKWRNSRVQIFLKWCWQWFICKKEFASRYDWISYLFIFACYVFCIGIVIICLLNDFYNSNKSLYQERAFFTMDFLWMRNPLLRRAIVACHQSLDIWLTLDGCTVRQSQHFFSDGVYQHWTQVEHEN